ncbi:MAG: protein-glutamate O-methyltransferase CheR [Deltaproteobacteria bacterium]|nr:protein-glutamate O-methyltransferase CheR [Deltaproteobacteria bacterium]
MISPLSKTQFELFIRLIKKHTGISFSRRNVATLQRKLSTRMSQLGLDSYRGYYDYLLHDKNGGLELRQLINRLTVDQTAFFRNTKQFEHTANIILPHIAKHKTTKKLRIWSAGCATGEEPYSIAMVVDDTFGDADGWDIKILGTDIDTDALKFAYNGSYPSRSVKAIPTEYLERYFTEGTGKDKGLFLAKEGLKKNIVFRRLNFMSAEFPFKSPVDIIFCRNVMIYFDPAFKTKLIDSFYHLLETDGFLCLGASESLIGVDKRFALVGHSTYQKQR